MKPDTKRLILIATLLLAVLLALRVLTAPLVQASTYDKIEVRLGSANTDTDTPTTNVSLVKEFAALTNRGGLSVLGDYYFKTQAKIAKQKAEAKEKERLEAIRAKARARAVYLASIKPKPVYTPQISSSGNLYAYHSCTWWAKNNRPSIPNGWGNASNWLYSARNAGYSTGATPRAGAIGTRLGGNHVVYVISVSGDQVTVGDGNYDYNGSYRIKTVHYSEFYYIY